MRGQSAGSLLSEVFHELSNVSSEGANHPVDDCLARTEAKRRRERERPEHEMIFNETVR